MRGSSISAKHSANAPIYIISNNSILRLNAMNNVIIPTFSQRHGYCLARLLLGLPNDISPNLEFPYSKHVEVT